MQLRWKDSIHLPGFNMGLGEGGKNSQAECHLEDPLSTQKPLRLHNLMPFSVAYPLSHNKCVSIWWGSLFNFFI